MSDIDGLVQERRNSIADALNLRLSWTNPSIYSLLELFSITLLLYPPYPKDMWILWFHVEAFRRPSPAARRMVVSIHPSIHPSTHPSIHPSIRIHFDIKVLSRAPFYGVGSTRLCRTPALYASLFYGSMPARPQLATSLFIHSDHGFLGVPCFLVPGIGKFVIDLMQVRCTWR